VLVVVPHGPVAHHSTVAWGKAVATALTSGRSFFAIRLLFRIGHRVVRWTRPRHPMAGRGLEPMQVDPAALARDRSSEPSTHPLGHRASTPVVVFGGRPGQGRAQLLLPFDRE
jgi:hypothetical protein